MKRVCVTAGSPSKMPDAKVQPYLEALRAVNLEPVVVRPGQQVPSYDGLMLTGGTDIEPDRYRAQRDPRTDESDTARDELELTLLSAAMRDSILVFAICRGMQLFNVYYGGTLHQHIEEHAQPGVSDAHSITVDDGSQLAAIIGAGNHLINSRHHQAVDQPGPKLLVTAHSTDGRIEALELPGHPFAIAVQWHPEDRIQNSPCDLRLFRAFAAKLDA